MRSMRSELVSAMPVLAVPVAIAFVFPCGALRFSASDPVAASARTTVAFVRLSAAEEATARRTARTSLHAGEGGVRRLLADLSVREIPDEPWPSVLPFAARSRPPALPPIVAERPPYLPSLRAAPPVKIAVDRDAHDAPAFSREELLRVN